MIWTIVYFIITPLTYLIFRPKVTGRENIPDGGFLLCANHQSMLDPVLLFTSFGYKRHLRFMAKAELFSVPVLGWILYKMESFPVNRGKSDIKSIKKALTFLKDGRNVVIFPQGTRVDDEDAAAAKTGAAMLALKTGVPVLPVHIDNVRKLGLKRCRINIGKPVVFPERSEARTGEYYETCALEIMRCIDALK